MKAAEFRKLIREEVRKIVKETVGQARDNKDNILGFRSLLRNPSKSKEVMKDFEDILNDNKQFAEEFDNMISNFLDEPIRGL